MEHPRYGFGPVAAALKQAMRKKRISYRELGDAVGMSESGIKKIMTGDDVSLGKLAALCEAVGIDPVDLLQVAWSAPAAPVTFTAEQEAFFVEHPACHAFFRALLTCRFDLSAIRRDYALDERSIEHYVEQLAEHGFVRATVDGVKSTFGDGGWYRYHTPDTCEHVIASLRAALDAPKEDRCIRNGRVRMTAKHLDELNRALLDLLLEYQVIATQDELHVPDDELIDVFVLAGTARQGLHEVLKIPRVA